MMNQIFRSIFSGIVSNIITAILFPAIITLQLYLNVSLESRLAICNMAFILTTILLILNHHFSPRRVRVIQIHDRDHVYFIEQNIARHIPDPHTFEYLGKLHGFAWNDIDKITNDEFKKQFSAGSSLPSIVPHCQKFCEERVKE